MSKKYSMENGLSSNRVYSIVQDSCGFLWFGTNNGLNRFDGINFRKYFFSDNNGSISSNNIRQLCIDKNNKIWISLDNGIDIYDPKKDTFTHFNETTPAGDSINCRVLDILEDNDGHMWIATNNKGLFYFIPENKTLRRYDTAGDIDLLNSPIIDIHEDSKKNIWIGTMNDGLILYNKKAGVFQNYKKEYPNNLSDNSIHKIFEDSYGDLWIGTFQNGLDKFDYETNSFTNFKDNSPENLLYHIHDISEHKPGELLIASDNGLGIFNIEKGIISSFSHTKSREEDLFNKFIYCIYKDQEGSFWAGSYYDGIDFYSELQNQFDFFHCSSYENPKKGKVINTICEDTDNNAFWIGTDDNGLFRFDEKSKKIIPVRTASDINSTYYCIHDLILDKDLLYMATYERGLEIYNIKTGEIKSYLHIKNDSTSLPSSRLFTIYKSSNGRIFIGTSSGLCYYNREKDVFVQTPVKVRVSSIIEDSFGKLWIATLEDGLFCLDLKNESLKKYIYEPHNSHSLIRNTLTTLSIDKHKRLWIGSDGYGICQYNREQDNFIRFPNLTLPNDVVSQIIPDNDNLWIATNKGLFFYNSENGNIRTFSHSNGLYSESFSPGAGIFSQNGKMLLGTTNGFCYFSPRNLSQNTFNPHILITGLNFWGKSKSQNDYNRYLPQSIEYMHEIILDSDISVIGFEFASLSYIAPQSNEYKFKLEGFDSEWRYMKGNNHFVNYTNLSPGNYTLLVNGTNSDQLWSDNECRLKIKVLPPFYQSSWAYCFYFIFIVSALLIAIVAYIKYANKKQQRKMNELNSEKEIELYNSKINFFTNIAHEIRTPLSLIIGPLELLIQSHSINEAYGNYLSIIQQNYKRLSTLVNELLDFRKIESGNYAISFNQCNIKKLIEEITHRFEWESSEKGIHIDFSSVREDAMIVTDQEIITKILTNLLSNAFKFAKKSIIITFDEKDNGFELSVTDDGIGIPDEEKENIFTAFYQIKNGSDKFKSGTGIGLHLSYSLAQLLGGTIKAVNRKDNCAGITMCVNLCKKDITSIAQNKIEDLFLSEDATTMKYQIKEEELIQNFSSRQHSILIVDDNPEILDFLSNILSNDYFVISALSAEDGLNILKNNQLDLILSDVMMEGINGFDFCSTIKSDINTSHIPFVLLTAKTDTGSKIEGLNAGADAYIEKPFSPSYLVAQLKNLLRKRSELRDSYAKDPLSQIQTTVYNKLDEEFIEKCTNIITQNLSESDFSVNTLAKEIGMSRTGIFVKLKSITGMTPNDFIKIIRLKTACKMMIEGNYRITEIGFLVGFNSSSYFAKCFQKQFGKLPTEFMKDLKAKNPADRIDSEYINEILDA